LISHKKSVQEQRDEALYVTRISDMHAVIEFTVTIKNFDSSTFTSMPATGRDRPV